MNNLNEKFKKAKELLKKNGQEHLLLYYDKLDDAKKEELLDQILSINYDLAKQLYKAAKEEVSFEDMTIEPIEYIDKSKLTVDETKKYEEIGAEAIKANKYAVVTMAGGQGTRLGHTGPKGTFDMGLESHKSLFELLCDTLKRARDEYKVVIPWYIMTSRENNAETVAFFERNNYFGYPKDAIKFFVQGELPMISMDGKILLDENGLVKEAADGHGGTLKAMGKNKIIEEMKNNGIEWVFISGVDNVLVKSVDPILLGMSIDAKVLGAVKTIEKTDPKEKVGVFCRKNKKVGVIEYTEISEEMANMRDDYGSLVYGDANAIFHLYNIKGLEKVSDVRLPYHTAVKKAKYIDSEGKLVIPEKPNAYKFELFIFDSYEMLDDVVVLRVKREEEFAPIKNAEGADSPETARKLYTDYWNRMEYLSKYEKWCKDANIDKSLRDELFAIKGNEEEIKDRFYKDLDFGTAGLRGIIGAGTNRMNYTTVGKATQGLANYILNQGTADKGVVISYDSRKMSKEFSEYTALCFNANGIKTYIMDQLRPVPELSFAIRELGATAGIMITASHNTAQYNGYKVYWDDGAQIVSPRDKDIIAEVNKVDYADIKTMSRDEAGDKRLYFKVGKAIDDAYNRTIKKLSLNPEVIKKVEKDIKIVYTPLHGAGNKAVQRVLDELGFTNVYVVPEQELPDGHFPTVVHPNPEDPKAYDLALRLAKRVDADLVLATDPDTDRLGIQVKNDKGEYELFTGNMTAMLVAEYILSQMKEKKTLPKNGTLIKSIVSTNLADDIAKEYGVELIEVLTGFKYIGEQMRLFEENKDKQYIFGFEESYGCLYGDHARDKDGVVAVMMLCEAAAYYKSKNITLWEQMQNIYKKYGYYKETPVSITLKGADGAKKIKQITDSLRVNPIKNFGKYKVLVTRDYQTGVAKDMKTGKETVLDLPKSNVLYYELENNEWCCVRPSGTEPKLKLYIGVKGKSEEDATKRMEELKSEMLTIIE